MVWSTGFQVPFPQFILLLLLLLLFSVSLLEPPGKVNWENVSSLLSDAVSDGHSSVNKTNCQLGLPSFSLALHRLVPGEHPAET